METAARQGNGTGGCPTGRPGGAAWVRRRPGAGTHASSKLDHAARREVAVVSGGVSAGHPCEALAHHGYNGIEGEVVDRMVRFVLGP
jgi:hypothetical protein